MMERFADYLCYLFLGLIVIGSIAIMLGLTAIIIYSIILMWWWVRILFIMFILLAIAVGIKVDDIITSQTVKKKFINKEEE